MSIFIVKNFKLNKSDIAIIPFFSQPKMEQQVISLIYLFLSDKDQSLAEIFKRQFSPDLSNVSDLPSLIEIVEDYIKKTKKSSSKKDCNEPIDLNSSQVSAMIQSTKMNPSSFLERIVKMRDGAKISSDEDSSDESTKDEHQLSVSSESSPEVITSAAKRRRTSTGAQKIWQKKSNK